MTTKNNAKWLPKQPQNRQNYSPETKPKNKPKIYAKKLPKWSPNGFPKGSKMIPKSDRKNDQKMIKKIPPPGVTGRIRVEKSRRKRLSAYKPDLLLKGVVLLLTPVDPNFNCILNYR